jgi:Lrp/AsnC family leucine-responsive transcriptional regulator
MKFDRNDVTILQALQGNAHVKAADLAESLGLSLSPCTGASGCSKMPG